MTINRTFVAAVVLVLLGTTLLGVAVATDYPAVDSAPTLEDDGQGADDEPTLEATGSVTVTIHSEYEVEPEPEPAVDWYTDEDHVVDTDGLRTAIDDWRSDEIDTEFLREVIDHWRSSEPVDS